MYTTDTSAERTARRSEALRSAAAPTRSLSPAGQAQPSRRLKFPPLMYVLVLLAGTLLPAACGVPEDHIRIEGKFSQIGRAEFCVYCDDGTFAGIDTIVVEKGKFSYERPLARTTVLTLLFPNFYKLDIVAEPGTTVKVQGDASHLAATDISGTEENELLTRFRQQNLNKPERQARMAASQFIRDHSASTAAVALFRQYFLETKDYDPTAASLLDALRKAQPRNMSLLALEPQLRPMLKNAPGQLLSDFSTPLLDGGTARRSDYKGRPLLVVFFADWNSEGRGLMSEVRNLRRAFGQRLGLLLVSLDAEESRCRRFLETDSLETAPVVFDGEAFSTPLARLFGVRYVPGTLLVDASGRIVDRDIPQAALRDRVAALLK